MDQKKSGTVLITGGAGGLGAVFTRRFVAAGHKVRVFDLPTDNNKRTFGAGEPGVELFWGDVTDPKSIGAAVRGVGHVFHLAALVVPATEKNPALAHGINVGGTKNVFDAAAAESERVGRAIPVGFSSSVVVYGITNTETPPIRINHPVNPCDVYSETKVRAEEVVRKSGLNWTIYRFGAIPYLSIRKGDFESMRMIPPENRLEFCHLFDVCDGLINSLDNPEIFGKTFVMGGGKRNQLVYKEQIACHFKFLGMPEPNWNKFSKKPFPLDWYDTEETQRILKFQKRTYDDYLQDFGKSFGRLKLFGSRYVGGPAMKLLGIHL
jgi:UDP-glucose 4-epimerase